MSYHVVDPADIDPAPDRPSEIRYVSEAAGMAHTGLRLYDVTPGVEIPGPGLHYRDRQEEALSVVEGRRDIGTSDRPAASRRDSSSSPRKPSGRTTARPPDAATTVGDGHVYDG